MTDKEINMLQYQNDRYRLLFNWLHKQDWYRKEEAAKYVNSFIDYDL